MLDSLDFKKENSKSGLIKSLKSRDIKIIELNNFVIDHGFKRNLIDHGFNNQTKNQSDACIVENPDWC